MDVPLSNVSGTSAVAFPHDRSTTGNNASNPPETQPAGTEKVTSKVIGAKAENIHYIHRQAVRIITTNDEAEIILIHAKKGDYYKLPGGGIEEGEDHRLAGVREAKEETGCKVALARDCFAMTEEFRNDLHQISYCYAAHLVEDTGAIELTDDELVDGLQHEWVSVRAAIAKMKASQPTSALGRFIKERDLYFVEKYADKNGEELPSVGQRV